MEKNKLTAEIAEDAQSAIIIHISINKSQIQNSLQTRKYYEHSRD